MVKKKLNPRKGTKSGGVIPVLEDVTIHTGLPPKVDGQLRCFCKVSISQVLWSVPSPPSTVVRLKWWGEEGEGALFRPLDIKKGNKFTTQTTARYPVCSGPRQFASYLNDMGTLSVQVFTSEKAAEPAGLSHIPQIGLLSYNRPISGFFPIVSAKDQKLGELHMTVTLEPLMASYDNMGSIPTTDLTTDIRHSQESMLPLATHPQPHTQQPVKPQEDPFISPASHLTGDAGLQNYSATSTSNYDLRPQGYPCAVTTSGHVIDISDIHGNGTTVVSRKDIRSQNKADSLKTQGKKDSDLLSVLLSRGKELREAMVVSSLNVQDREQNNSNISGQLQPVVNMPATYSPAPGVIVDNLLGEKSSVDGLIGSPVGRHDWQMLQMLNSASPGASICSEEMTGMDLISDPEDPLHDTTLLQALFYKRSDSELSELSGLSEDDERSKQSSLQDPGNMRPPSRSSSFLSLVASLPASNDTPTKKRKRKLKSSRSSSEPAKTVRKSRSRERNLRRTKTVPSKKLKSKSRSRSRSKSRSGSRSLSGKRKGSLSDSDITTPRSESSRVSFDPVPSDVEDNMDQEPGEKQVDGLSVERLTLLGRVHVARVNILSLKLHGSDLDTSSSSQASRSSAKRAGKPPRPLKSRKPCTYLIEYQFPVVAISRDKYSPNAMATEVMRVASKAINNGVVSFSHRSVFPLMFDGAALEKWWKSALVFKVYSREAGQKAPVFLGSCGIPLKSILKSDDLHLTRELEIRDVGRNGFHNNSLRNASLNSPHLSPSLLGTLKVSVELASDHKDFATCLARTRLAEMCSHTVVPLVPSSPPPQHRPPSPAQASMSLTHHGARKQTSPSMSLTHHGARKQTSPSRCPQQVESRLKQSLQHPKSQPSSIPVLSPDNLEQSQFHKPVFQVTAAPQQSSQPEALTLHTLIMIPEGCNISLQGIPPLQMVSRNPTLLQQQLAHISQSGRDQMTRNTYLACRMFWSNDSVHSDVCWGSLNPQYSFCQVAPVLVTPSLLERMRNNYMIVEVWDKKVSAEHDKLIGITKLSLHQFFMSFREVKIAGALLRSEYPVLAIDNYMPVVDPFTGLHFGQLSVLLAMGSAEQIVCLQRLKTNKDIRSSPQRPRHFLERQDVYCHDQSSVKLNSSANLVEHVFEVVIQGVRGLRLLETMIWGEADCFVQYFFPDEGKSQHQRPTALPASLVLRSFRTSTTLCIPDPTFHDVTRHRITLPVGIPVQRELLTACANSVGGSGGLPFEVWCRFYHPNVRDQVIARATLPLAKLCAMVTMQKRGELSVQSFSLPLTPVASGSQDAESVAKMKDCGLIDVTVHYKTQNIENSVNISHPASSSQVRLSVIVTRATALKAAAEAAVQLDSGMQYPAEVGVNAFVRVRLSFLGKEEERITKTVARTFSPEFSHHMEFPLQLLWSGDHEEPENLAHLLETGQAQFEVWHQVPSRTAGLTEYECDDTTGGKRLMQASGDVLLGTCAVSLAKLLIKHTGVKGWFPLNRPTDTWAKVDEGASSSRMVGGLELCMHFAHSSDRQRVVEAARSVGWSPIDLAVERDVCQTGEQQQQQQIVVNIEQVSLPRVHALLPGQTDLDSSACCYIRYKFFDKAPVVSRASQLEGSGENLQAEIEHSHTMIFPSTALFQWYLQEENLEIQVWLTHDSKGKAQRPLSRDKLIGTAYVELLPLNDSHRKQHRISGLLPLFKPGTADLAKTFVHLHLTSTLCPGIQLLDDLGDDDMSDLDYDSSDSFHHLTSNSRSPVRKTKAEKELEQGQIFTVHIAIERALHLPTVRIPGRSGEVAPTTYISYQTADKATPTYTDVVVDSVNPVWDYVAEVPLSNELLTKDGKNLVLKVWHKPTGACKEPDKSSDRVLGFVSVDVCPLNSGLLQICGWYNIVDFSGQNRGQIKVSITPVDLVTTANNISNNGEPSLSMHSTRGGSLYLPSGHHTMAFSLHPTSHSAVPGLDIGRETPLSHASVPMPRPHWQPRFSVPSVAATEDSSKSMLFCSLRQQMKDLDGLTQRLRLRLSCEDADVEVNQPGSARSADILTGTHSGLSTIRTSSSLMGTHEALSDVSRQLLASLEMNLETSQQQNRSTSEENSSHNAMDSGAFSGNNTGKSQELPDSHRNEERLAFGEAHAMKAKASSDLLPAKTPAVTSLAATAEAQYRLESSQGALTLRSPGDFSSNSQTSQGFHLMAIEESSTSGSIRIQNTKVPHLSKRKVEEQEKSQESFIITDAEPEKVDTLKEDSQHNFVEYHSDDSCDDEMFGSYHQYRAMLDQEEEENPDYDCDERSNTETVTPRRINDVSGMLKQFAQHAGTFLPFFPPQRNADSAHTWSRTSQQNPVMERTVDKGKTENQEEKEEIENEQLAAKPLLADRTEVVCDRNSFIDSWLEDSAEQENDQKMLQTFQQFADDTSVPQLQLDVQASGTAVNGTQTRQLSRDSKTTFVANVSSVASMHLLSNVELIDSLTSVQNLAQRRHGGSRQNEALRKQTSRENEQRRVGSFSGTSTYAPHHHHLSDVELVSTASESSHHPNTGSSRPSQQSSVHSASRKYELETCAEVDSGADRGEHISGQSERLSYAGCQQATVADGVYASSDDDFDYQFSIHTKSQTVKGVEPCQSVAGTAEDSGLESGAKSSQDDRESLLDSAHGQPKEAPKLEFFPPLDELQASMRALKLATSAAVWADQDTQTRSAARVQASADLNHRLKKAGATTAKFNGTISAKGKRLPTAEEAKRIAKIFSTKPS